MNQLEQAVEARKAAKFMPLAYIPHEYYDCVTFALCIYKELGVLPAEASFPDYHVYTRGSKMLDLICQWVEESEAFEEVEEVTEGCLVVSSKGNRGHHVGIYLGDDQIAHCSKFKNVQIESFTTGVFGNCIYKIYQPHGME